MLGKAGNLEREREKEINKNNKRLKSSISAMCFIYEILKQNSTYFMLINIDMGIIKSEKVNSIKKHIGEKKRQKYTRSGLGESIKQKIRSHTV